MTGQDVELFYFNNPPFEITDKVKYAEFLQFQSQLTLMELSENAPVLSETTVTSSAAVADEEVVRLDLRTIHESFFRLILIQPTADLVNLFSSDGFYQVSGRPVFGYISSTAVATAMRSNSVLNLLAVNDYIPIIEEWFASKKQYMIFDNTYIKVTPSTEYYVLFKRYKTINELVSSELRTFKSLLGLNIMLDIYQSDTFAAEGGIRSVSLSGLSVSFNVPEATSKLASLNKQKKELLASIALDYSDDCVGLI